MILTVDILITIKRGKILLIKRRKEPFLDKLVLPGGHVEEHGLSLAEACAREAAEEIGFQVDISDLKLLTVLDEPNRDPRTGRRVSLVFHINLPDLSRIENCQAMSDAKSIHLRDIKKLRKIEIGFDHYKAIKLIS